MLYNLPNGKTIHLSIDEFLTITDDEIQFLVAYGYGEVINNPRYGSAVNTNEDPEDEELEDAEDREMPEVTLLEKYSDLDAPLDY